jgi:hypothetical protein
MVVCTVRGVFVGMDNEAIEGIGMMGAHVIKGTIKGCYCKVGEERKGER